jgi:hypothetical protein
VLHASENKHKTHRARYSNDEFVFTGCFHPVVLCLEYNGLSCPTRKWQIESGRIMTAPDVPEFVLALDWTPNINHVGFFVAVARGYFSKGDLKVRFISPHSDDYKTTPAQKIVNGDAHAAICPSESVISYASQVRCLDDATVELFTVFSSSQASVLATARQALRGDRI